jgi:hypothetical protein
MLSLEMLFTISLFLFFSLQLLCDIVSNTFGLYVYHFFPLIKYFVNKYVETYV